MYVKWIPAVLFGSCFLIAAGLYAGTRMEMGRNQKLNQYSSQIRTTIAVVNQDVGADNYGIKENYSAAIIETLGPEYVLVPPQEAQNGYEAGRYGAVLMFPSDLSKKVLSINTWEPERVELEFMIHPSLPEGKYINLYTKIISLQSRINESLSYTYVASIYDEFHGAQDSTRELFKNDKADMEAAGKVKLTNFTESLNLHDAPRTVFEVKEIDFQAFVSQVRGYAEDLSGQYQESYQRARDDYEIVQSRTLDFSSRIRDDSIEWQDQVDEWGIRVDDYGRALEEYSYKLDTWITEAEKWQDEAVQWNEKVEVYQKDVEDWRIKSDQDLGVYQMDWESKTQEIDEKLKAYCADLNEYKDNVDKYRDAVADYADLVLNPEESNPGETNPGETNPGETNPGPEGGGETDDEENAGTATGSEAIKDEKDSGIEKKNENTMEDVTQNKGTADERPVDEEDSDDGGTDEKTLDGETGGSLEEKKPETGESSGVEERKPVSSESGGEEERKPVSSESGGIEERNSGRSERGGEEERKPDSSESGGEEERKPISSESGGTEEKKPDSSKSGGAEERKLVNSRSGGAEERKPVSSKSGGTEERKLVSSERGGTEERKLVSSESGSIEERKPDRSESEGAEERKPDSSESGGTEEVKPDSDEGDGAGNDSQINGKMAMYAAVYEEEEDDELEDEGEVWLINDLEADNEDSVGGDNTELPGDSAIILPATVSNAAAAAEESSQKVKDFPDIPELPALTLDAYAGSPKPDFEGGMAPALNKQIPQNEAGNFPQLPDGLTEALRSLENEVLVYDAGNYLVGEASGRINTLVGNYQKNLGTVEREVNRHLRDQTREQDRANREYQKFLEDLGKEAQDTNEAEQKKLTTAIDLFYSAKEKTSRENQDLLADFAAKLPFSRNHSTLNKSVVEFTVAPLAFTDTQVRPLASVNEQRQKQLLRDQLWLIALLSLCTLLALIGGIAGKIRRSYSNDGDDDE